MIVRCTRYDGTTMAVNLSQVVAITCTNYGGAATPDVTTLTTVGGTQFDVRESIDFFVNAGVANKVFDRTIP